MARVTFPAVFFDKERQEFVCEMKDKKTGRVWSRGYGQTAQEAIANARHTQPSAGYIRKSIGWVVRHPIIGGSFAGVALAFRDAKNNGYHDWKRYAKFALIGATVGLVAYAGMKILSGFLKARKNARIMNSYN